MRVHRALLLASLTVAAWLGAAGPSTAAWTTSSIEQGDGQGGQMSKTPRFFINHDGSYLHYVAPPITLERFLNETLGTVQGTQVDSLICHMFTFGDAVPLFNTHVDAAKPVMPEKAASANVWRSIHNRAALLAMEQDPWEILIQKTHEQGKQFWGSMRFNDSHPPEYGLCSRFRKEHPEYLLGERCGSTQHDPGPDGSVPPCRNLDFAIPEVRELRLRLIEELCSRYNVDGFEWDFTRASGHNFAKGMQEQGRRILTEYMREVRKVLDRIGQQRGRPLGFAVRVPGTLEVCWETGLDVRTWIKEGLLEMVTPTVYYDTTCELPFHTFVKMAEGTPTRIYASVTEGVGPGRFRPPPIEAVRAATLNAWRQGVAGINLFNFHHPVAYNRPADLAYLSEMGNPATLARKNKLYMIAGTAVACQERFFQKPYHTAFKHQLPVDLSEQPNGPGVVVRVPVGDDIAAAKTDKVLASIILRLDLLHLTGKEKLRLSINGRPVPISSAKWRISRQYAFNWNGLHGDWEASFDLTDGDWIRQGDNEITLTLLSRPKDIALPMTLYTLQLEVNYNVLPMGLK